MVKQRMDHISIKHTVKNLAGTLGQTFSTLFGGSEMVCLKPIINFLGPILDLGPGMLQKGLKWFGLEHRLDKTASHALLQR